MHEQRCETCHKLEKEFGDWGFDPYCILKPIPLIVWEWIKEFGCASWQEEEL